RKAREANIAKRREVLTGASEFPNLHEVGVAVLDAKPIALAPYGETKFKFDALPPMRLATPFEVLRDKSDAILKKSGARPKIFLANLGTAADFTARAEVGRSLSADGVSMTSDREAILTGGCQCGAVRFAVYAPPVKIGLCHCRMCQKAVGGPFISLADVKLKDFAWTRGKPAAFRSSSIAERDFCAACGTPLSYRRIGGPKIEIMTGTFDRPDRVVPTRQFGTESRLGWVVGIANLPSQTTLQNYGTEKLGGIVSHQ